MFDARMEGDMMDTQRRYPLISFTDREVYACPFPVYDRLRE